MDIAKSLGFDVVHINIDEIISEDEQVNQLIKIIGSAPDCVIECAGAQSSIRLGILAVKDGGNVTLLGYGPPNVTVPLTDASCREVNLLGVKRCTNT